MDIRLRAYHKKLKFSYAPGVTTCLELIKQQPESILKFILHPKAKESAGIQQIKKYCQDNKIDIEMGDGIIKKITGKENIFALGIFNKYQSVVKPNLNHVCLYNPEDAGNFGTIIRTMLGFGINNVVLIRPAVDIFNPKTIRASMGAIFRVNFQYFDNFDQYLEKNPNSIYAFMTDGKEKLSNAKFQFPYTLVFGSESSGLPLEFKEKYNSVQIEQTDKIDSLNLAVSVGISIYQSTVCKTK